MSRLFSAYRRSGGTVSCRVLSQRMRGVGRANDRKVLSGIIYVHQEWTSVGGCAH